MSFNVAGSKKREEWGSGFRVRGSGFRVSGSEFIVSCENFRFPEPGTLNSKNNSEVIIRNEIGTNKSSGLD